MIFSWSKIACLRACLAASMTMATFAFNMRPSIKSVHTSLKMVSVDPSVVTRKEYQDICGVSFDERSLADRLQATNYLYPRHVEVIEDIAPIAGKMVDEIVSLSRRSSETICRAVMSDFNLFTFLYENRFTIGKMLCFTSTHDAVILYVAP